jgi:hypothetical protein
MREVLKELEAAFREEIVPSVLDWLRFAGSSVERGLRRLKLTAIGRMQPFS